MNQRACQDDSRKIKFLTFAWDQTQNRIATREELKKVKDDSMLKTNLNEYKSLKIRILELKIVNDENTDDIRKWRWEIYRCLKEL